MTTKREREIAVLVYRAAVLSDAGVYTSDDWKEIRAIEFAAWSWWNAIPEAAHTREEAELLDAVGGYLKEARENMRAGGFVETYPAAI